MGKRVKTSLCVLVVLVAFSSVARSAEILLSDVSRLDIRGAEAQPTSYHGQPALRLTGKELYQSDGLAVIRNQAFHNGTIEVEVAGAPRKTAPGDARGFIGIAFRTQADASHYECLYIRPTNGRSDDQLRRNHSTQYSSFPEWPWDRLRSESPGVYESYADMMPGEWTHLRIVVHGTNAALYIGKAEQPSLVIHDLKLGDSQGGIALWIGPGTEGYFRNLRVLGEEKNGETKIDGG